MLSSTYLRRIYDSQCPIFRLFWCLWILFKWIDSSKEYIFCSCGISLLLRTIFALLHMIKSYNYSIKHILTSVRSFIYNKSRQYMWNCLYLPLNLSKYVLHQRNHSVEICSWSHNSNADPFKSEWFFFCSHYFFSFWFQQHQLNAPATPNLAKPIVRQVRTEETSSNVTATILLLGGTASQMLLEPECLPPQWRYIIVAPMHRAGWMVNILLKMMELSSEWFASTGTTTFVSGT